MYRFLTSDPPTNYKRNYVAHLFNEREHRLLQIPAGWQSFYLVDEDHQEILGGVHFCIDQHLASSPFRSPYGGYELNSALPQSVLNDFVQLVDGELKKQDVRLVEIKLPSRPVADVWPIEQVLTDQGYQIIRSEKAAMLSVSDRFVERLHFSEQKRLRKLREKNFQVEQLAIDKWQTVYEFIHRCRTQKGFPLSMTRDQIGDLVAKFSERIFLFRVIHGSDWAAASFCVQTSSDTVYDFYHDHDASFDAFSPVVLLVTFMNGFFLERNVHRIDLGTSMLDDAVNEGLLTFKKRLGANEFVKLTFQKTLS